MNCKGASWFCVRTGRSDLSTEKCTKYLLEQYPSRKPPKHKDLTDNNQIFIFWASSSGVLDCVSLLTCCSAGSVHVKEMFLAAAYKPTGLVFSTAPLFDSNNKVSHRTTLCYLQHHLQANSTILKVAALGRQWWGRGGRLVGLWAVKHLLNIPVSPAGAGHYALEASFLSRLLQPPLLQALQYLYFNRLKLQRKKLIMFFFFFLNNC